MMALPSHLLCLFYWHRISIATTGVVSVVQLRRKRHCNFSCLFWAQTVRLHLVVHATASTASVLSWHHSFSVSWVTHCSFLFSGEFFYSLNWGDFSISPLYILAVDGRLFVTVAVVHSLMLVAAMPWSSRPVEKVVVIKTHHLHLASVAQVQWRALGTDIPFIGFSHW